MAIFDQKTAAKKDSAPFSASDLPPFRDPPPAHADAGTGPAPGTVPRQQPVQDRRARSPHVQLTGGGGGEAEAC